MSKKPFEITVADDQERKIVLEKLEVEIIKLWNGVEDSVDSIRTLGNIAVRGAWEIGERLWRAKSILHHGSFGLWKEKMGIPETTAHRYMALAKKFPTVESLPANIREGYLAVGILPQKELFEHEGDIKLRPSQHHLQFINRWSNWLNQVKIGKVNFDREQVRTDLKPLYDWLTNEVYCEK